MSQIQIKCSGTENVALDGLVDIQGEVKGISDENLQKLLNTMRDNGFCEPFVIWRDEGKRPVIISGNQRLKALNKATKLGWSLPSSFPAVEVQAKNYKEAVKILVSLQSYYGRVDKDKFEDFVIESGFSVDEVIMNVDFPEVSFDTDDSEVHSDEEPIESADGSLEFIRIPFLLEDYMEAKKLWDDCFNLLFDNSGEVQTPTDAFMHIMRKFHEENKPKTGK